MGMSLMRQVSYVYFKNAPSLDAHEETIRLMKEIHLYDVPELTEQSAVVV